MYNPGYIYMCAIYQQCDYIYVHLCVIGHLHHAALLADCLCLNIVYIL